MKSFTGIQYQPVLDALDISAIRREISRSQQGGILKTILTEMAQKKGIPVEDSAKLADSVMEQVHSFEAMKAAVSDDPHETMNALLTAMQQMDPQNRLILMDHLNRMLGTISGAEEDAALEQRPEWLNEETGDARLPELEAALRKQILKKTAHSCLSPDYMEYLINMISGYQITASCDALGVNGYALKCVTAMHLSVRDGGYSEEAVARNVLYSCTMTEMEAVGDAVSQRLMTEQRAYNLLCILVLSAIIFAFFFFLLCYAGVFAPLPAAQLTPLLKQEILTRFLDVGISALGALMYGGIPGILLCALLDESLREGASRLVCLTEKKRSLTRDGADTVTLGLKQASRYSESISVRNVGDDTPGLRAGTKVRDSRHVQIPSV